MCCTLQLWKPSHPSRKNNMNCRHRQADILCDHWDAWWQVVASVAATDLAPGLSATLTGTIPDVNSAKVRCSAPSCRRVACEAINQAPCISWQPLDCLLHAACCNCSKSDQDAAKVSHCAQGHPNPQAKHALLCGVAKSNRLCRSHAHGPACTLQIGVDYIIPHLTVNGTTSLANNPIVEIAASTGRADMFLGGNFVFNSGSNKVSNWTVGAGKQLALGCRSPCCQLVSPASGYSLVMCLWIASCKYTGDTLGASSWS